MPNEIWSNANVTGPEFVSTTAKARLSKLLGPVNYSFASKSFYQWCGQY